MTEKGANGNGRDKDRDEMQKAVHLRRTRRQAWEQEGERSFWQNLSMLGALGWLIVVPMVLGAFAGRWLDNRFGTGIFYSGALIFLGVCLGSYMAWKRMNEK